MSKKLSVQGWRYARGGPISKVLKLETFEVTASAKDAIIKMTAAPLHRADSAVVNGSATGRMKMAPFPRIGGCEGVGKVVSPGSSKVLKEGDTVWLAPIQGTWADTVVADPSLVHRIDPKHADLAIFGSNLLLAQRLINGCARFKGPNDVIIQNGGSSATSVAVSAFGKLQKRTVFTAASKGARFSAAVASHKAFGSQVFEYSSKGARQMQAAIGKDGNPVIFANGVGGKYFNDFMKLVGANGSVVTFGAQNGYGLMFAGSHQIFKEITLQGLYLPTYLRGLTYEERQTQLDFALKAAAEAGFKYPTTVAASLDKLPNVWDAAFVEGSAKGVLRL